MSKSKVSFKWAFKEFIWPRKKVVSLGILLIIVKSLAGLATPYVLKELVDTVFENKDIDGLYILILILSGALLIQALTSFSLTRLLSVEAQNLISKLRAQVQKNYSNYLSTFLITTSLER